ncbi:MAG: DUF2334 domain-containing protein [Candidatus Omnitrophica bacterium]|nr:DUF2334 domain-containing protein [Candidatus Omnitrophota bacterium]
MSGPVVFLRDDDIFKADAALLELDLLLEKHLLPIVYGVIPDRCDKETASMLKRRKQKAPDLIDLVQHGWAHNNYSKYAGSKFEFGGGRSYTKQHEDMQKGRLVMQKTFGQLFTPAFIPPFHGFDDNTLKVVDDLGFSVFSAGRRVMMAERKFIDLPALVSLNSYDSGGAPGVLEFSDMVAKLRKCLVLGGVSGVVYHHAAVKTEHDMRNMKRFLLFLAQERDRGHIRVKIFSDFIKAKYRVTAGRMAGKLHNGA